MNRKAVWETIDQWIGLSMKQHAKECPMFQLSPQPDWLFHAKECETFRAIKEECNSLMFQATGFEVEKHYALWFN